MSTFSVCTTTFSTPPGTYPAKIILSSSFDVRVVEVEGRARSPGMKAELDFACPARQQITQDIPITNRTEKDWIITSVLTGGQSLAVAKDRSRPSR